MLLFQVIALDVDAVAGLCISRISESFGQRFVFAGRRSTRKRQQRKEGADRVRTALTTRVTCAVCMICTTRARHTLR